MARKIIKNIVKFRWLLAFLVFVCLVFNKIHFSSIGKYYDMFPTVSSEEEKNNYKIFGETREIRSDEWLIHTPKYFSQQYNDYERQNPREGFTPKDNLIDYYAPVKDLSLIGKPFNLGYILFGNEYGLSFYFCMLEILLFMTSFEMFFILTKKNILTSFVGMLLIGLSPAMQWWLVPHLAIVFVYAMGIFSLVYYFFTVNNKTIKIILSCLLVSAILGFTFSIYPACQVMCVFILGFLVIVTLLRDRDIVNVNRFCVVMFAFVLIISIGMILYLVISSREALLKVFNTQYPGNRVSVGGTSKLQDLFTNLTCIFLPYKDCKDFGFNNSCEMAGFIHFGPLLLFMFYKIRKRLQSDEDKERYIGVFLYGLIILEIIFMCAGFPLTLSKITLFKYVNRMELCYGFTATIFTVWGFNIIWRKKDIFTKKECVTYSFLYCVILASFIDNMLRQYIGLKWLLVEILTLGLILLLGFLQLKKSFAVMMSSFMMVAGFTVNPICMGISPITNHPISEFVKEKVQQDKDGIWITLGKATTSSFLMANGARTIVFNSFYPDDKEWKLLNIDQKYYEFYNRYCHRFFYLSNKEQYIQLMHVDAIQIFITCETLKRLNVKYVTIDDEYFQTVDWPKGLKFEKIFAQDGVNVLKLSY